VLIGLQNPNHDSSEQVSTRSHWGLIQVPLSVRDVGQMVSVPTGGGVSTVNLNAIASYLLCCFPEYIWFLGPLLGRRKSRLSDLESHFQIRLGFPMCVYIIPQLLSC